MQRWTSSAKNINGHGLSHDTEGVFYMCKAWWIDAYLCTECLDADTHENRYMHARVWL